MKYKLQDFLALRTLIIHNSVLNPLLAASLSDNQSPVIVGKALVKLEGKLRSQLKAERGPKLPKYIMADILVSIGKDAKIGYSHLHFPPIWTSSLVTPNRGNISRLKSITQSVTKSYRINPAKADKIFTKLPPSLVNLLEENGMSSKYWYSGFSKTIKKSSSHRLNASELEKYYSALYRRLQDWRIFNKILISVIKKGFFEISNPDFGMLSVSRGCVGDDYLSISFVSYIDDTRQSAYLSCYNFTPTRWEVLNPSIDIFTLRKLFSNQSLSEKT